MELITLAVFARAPYKMPLARRFAHACILRPARDVRMSCGQCETRQDDRLHAPFAAAVPRGTLVHDEAFPRSLLNSRVYP